MNLLFFIVSRLCFSNSILNIFIVFWAVLGIIGYNKIVTFLINSNEVYTIVLSLFLSPFFLREAGLKIAEQC